MFHLGARIPGTHPQTVKAWCEWRAGEAVTKKGTAKRASRAGTKRTAGKGTART